MQMTVLYKEYGTILERDSQGDYYLSVLCGTIAQFGITISLNQKRLSDTKSGEIISFRNFLWTSLEIRTLFGHVT